MKQLKTYGKKRPLLPPDEHFNDQGESYETRPQKSRKLTTELAASVEPDVACSHPPPTKKDKIEELAGELLTSSPTHSDHSSSIKSIEAAMERRVSLLLKGETIQVPSQISRPRSEILESSPEPLPTIPSRLEADVGTSNSRSFRRFSSFVSPNPVVPPSSGARNASPSPRTKKRDNFSRRMSTILSSPHTPRSSPPAELASSPPLNSSPGKSGIDLGRRILERARLVISRSPLGSTKLSKKKGKGKEKEADRDELLDGAPNTGQDTAVYSPSSLFFDAPDLHYQPWVPTERTWVPSRPLTHNSTRTNQLPGGRSSAPASSAGHPPQEMASADAHQDLSENGRVTPKFHLVPGGQKDGRKRLGMVELTGEASLNLEPRLSVESERSNALSSVASGLPDRELRRTTAKIRKGSLLADSSSDSIKTNPKRQVRSSSLTTSSPAVAASTDSSQEKQLFLHTRPRAPLKEKDTNRRLTSGPEEDGSVKVARAIKVSVSPKVKEVFNKLPKKRPLARPPKVVEVVLSRSSSKASHILGHHVGSKEPLRPPRGDQVTARLLREESSSEDELAT